MLLYVVKYNFFNALLILVKLLFFIIQNYSFTYKFNIFFSKFINICMTMKLNIVANATEKKHINNKKLINKNYICQYIL